MGADGAHYEANGNGANYYCSTYYNLRAEDNLGEFYLAAGRREPKRRRTRSLIRPMHEEQKHSKVNSTCTRVDLIWSILVVLILRRAYVNFLPEHS